jgi:CRP-like cAMP-binding protein
MASGFPAPNLHSVRLLQSLAHGEREALARECSFVTVAKGSVIFSQGSADARGVAFVIAGRLSIRGSSPCGKEVVYAVVGPGGSAALDGRAPRTASVEADTESLLAFMPSSVFRRAVFGNARICQAVIDALMQMLRVSSERIIELATMKAPERVSREILRLAMTVPGSEVATSVEIPDMPDQMELARRTGLTRESVCRAFTRLQRVGAVERVGNGMLLVRDMAALRGQDADCAA